MAYTPFDQTKPTGAANGATTLQHVRENMAALRDIAALGAAPGWNYSYTAGTAEKPTTTLLSRGTERLRSIITWGTTGGGADNLTAVVFAYSSNSGSSYDDIGTQTVSYDASGNVLSTSWG